jgi:glucose-6-phosphate 1-dehydrogenase
MVQNHALQLLCAIAMEPPINAHADAIRDERVGGAEHVPV